MSELAKVSAACQKQVMRDLAPIWNISATVDAFPDLDDLPIGTWPVIVMDTIPYAAAGIHLDEDGQPFSLVTMSSDWSLTASHEILEMLVDPSGNRMLPGFSPRQGQARVQFLVEVCDPSEAWQFGYTVNGVQVSDFYTPEYFAPVHVDGTRYSFTGAIKAPRTVLEGGYLSWMDPTTDEWYQWTRFTADGKDTFINLGKLKVADGSIRSQIDLKMQDPANFMKPPAADAAKVAAPLTAMKKSSSAKSKALRDQITEIVSACKVSV